MIAEDRIVAEIRAESERNRAQSEKHIAELRAATEKGLGEIRVATEKNRAETGRQIAELRVETEKRIADLRVATEKGFGELRTEVEKGLGDCHAADERTRTDMASGFGALGKAIESAKLWMLVTGVGSVIMMFFITILGRVLKLF